MTGGAARRRASGVFNPVIAVITFRATMSRRRALLFAMPAVILAGVSLLLKLTARNSTWPPDFLGTFGFSVVLPLTALIIGTSVLGAEIDDGSVLHLLATPVRRSAVVLTKFSVAVAVTVAFAAVPELIAGLIATGGASRLAAGLFAGALAAAVIYNAIFVMVSVLTSRGIAVGLLYLLVWEGLLANLVSGASELSVGQYSLAIAGAISHNRDLDVHLSLLTAVFMGAIVTVAALVVAIRAVSGFSLKGEAV
jgi:ABC-2 type transport system permease protein